MWLETRPYFTLAFTELANSTQFRACLVWNKLPLSVKQSQLLIEFKSKIQIKKKKAAPAKFAIYNFVVNSD